jgi:hypothetical protein
MFSCYLRCNWYCRQKGIDTPSSMRPDRSWGCHCSRDGNTWNTRRHYRGRRDRCRCRLAMAVRFFNAFSRRGLFFLFISFGSYFKMDLWCANGSSLIIRWRLTHGLQCRRVYDKGISSRMAPCSRMAPSGCGCMLALELSLRLHVQCWRPTLVSQRTHATPQAKKKTRARFLDSKMKFQKMGA